MTTYQVEYKDCCFVKANSDEEALEKAWEQLFEDGPKFGNLAIVAHYSDTDKK